jgi:hypothetical protein
MYKRIHPYAIIIGLLIGISVLFILRHPLFALFLGFVGVLVSDLFIRKADEDEQP